MGSPAALAVCLGGALCSFATAWPARAEQLSLVPAKTSSAAAAVEARPGLTLEALLEIALEHNLQVKVAEAQIDEAAALYQFAAAQAYPRIVLIGLAGGPTPEARTTERNKLETLTPASFRNDLDLGELGFTVRANVDASLPLYTFGKIQKGKEAADHLVRAARENRVATQAEVALNVQRAFWAYQLTRAALVSLEEGKGTLEKVLRQVDALLEAESPQVTENDRLRMRFLLDTLAARATEAEVAQRIALRALRLLIGYPQERELVVAEAELDELPAAPPSIDALAKNARLDRPELKALREVVRAAEEFRTLRKRMFLPDIFLGGLFQFAYTSSATNQTNPFIFDPFNDVVVGLGVGVRVELDVFQKLAQLEQADAQARVRAAQAELAEQANELEVRRLHAEVEGSYQRVAQLERANRTARGWLTSSALAYDIGTGEAEELMDAFLAWASSEADLQRTRFDTLVRLTELARASGRLLGKEPALP
jgi:outer membrane protein TolC